MRHSRLVLGSLAIVVLQLVACGSDRPSGGSAAAKPGAPAAPGAPAPGPAPAAADANLVDVELTPLPLSIKVPKGGIGAMDMTIGDRKSVTVDIGKGGALNVHEMVEKSFADVKRSTKSDKILLPFKKFVRDDASSFVAEVAPDGKQGFVGATMKEIGGKKYVCKTTGLEGVKTAEIAEAALKVCDRIKAK